MPPPARGRRAAAAEDADYKLAQSPTEQVFKLGLKPPNDTENFKLSMQMVASEYATRYLEQIGVSPSKSTVDLVHKSIPLNSKCIKTTFRAKGHVVDEIQITVPPVNHNFKVHQVITPLSILQLGLGNEEAAALGGQGKQQTAATVGGQAAEDQQGEAGAGGLLPDPQHLPGSSFRHLAAKYLHPFHLDTNLARQQLESVVAASRGDTIEGRHRSMKRLQTVSLQHQTSLTQLILDTEGADGQGAGAGGSSRDRDRGAKDPGGSSRVQNGGWDPEVLKLEILEELLQELSVTPEVVLTLMSQLEGALVDWFKHQAPETLKGRLDKEEFKSTLELLTGEHTIKFFITTANFLHQEYVRDSPGYPYHLESKVQRSEPPSRSGSHRRPPGRAPSSAMLGSLPAVASMRSGRMGMMPTKLQHYSKYDLGFPEFLKSKEEQQARDEGSVTGSSYSSPTPFTPASTTAPPTRLPSANLSPRSALRHPQPAASAAESTAAGSPTGGGASSGFNVDQILSSLGTGGGTRARGISFTDKDRDDPGSQSQSRRAFSRQASHASTNSRAPAAPGGGSAAGPRRSSTIKFAPPPRQSNGGGLPPMAAPGGAVLQHSPPFGQQAASAPGSARSPSPSSFMDGLSRPDSSAVKSLQHLRSVRVLAAAAAAGKVALNSLDASDYRMLQQARLFVMLKEFAGLYKAQRATRAGMFFTLPIYLVALRLCTHMLFTSLYPLWSTTVEGSAAIETMDAALVHLFDPHGYLQRNLSILQSSPAAVSIMAKYPHKGHQAERAHFHDTSPLLRAAMTDPGSAGARRLLVAGAASKAKSAVNGKRSGGAAGGSGAAANAHADDAEGLDVGSGLTGRAAVDVLRPEAAARGPIKTQLSRAQQEALFREAHAMRMLAPDDPVLSALGDPGAAEQTSRTSWIPRQY